MAVLNKFLLASILFYGCGKSDSLKKEKVIDNIKYQVEYFDMHTLKSNVQDSLYKMEDLHYYRISISEDKKEGRMKDLFKAGNYNKLLSYVNERINKDFKQFAGTDETFPVMVHFEPNYKITNTLVFMVAFEKVKGINDLTMEFNDNIFNNGTVKFNYKLTS